MIVRRDTLNAISTLLAEGRSTGHIAWALNLAVADVKAAITAWKL
jgi:DNA-binding NarL/FixJ family response regulator